jgi:hypothetical protein
MMKALLIGNCQVAPLKAILNSLSSEANIEFYNCTPVHSISREEVNELHGSIRKYDVIFTQPITDNYRDNIGVSTSTIADLLSSRQCLFKFPNLHFEGYHPTYGYIRDCSQRLIRGKYLSDLSHDQFKIIELCDYHDVLILSGYLHEMHPSDLFEFMSSHQPQCSKKLADWFLSSLSRLRDKEAICNTSMTALIEELVLSGLVGQPVFHSFNHPTPLLLGCLAMQLLRLIDVNLFPTVGLETSLKAQAAYGWRDTFADTKLPVYEFVKTSIFQKSYLNPTFSSGPLKVKGQSLHLPDQIRLYFKFYDAIGGGANLMCNLDTVKGRLCRDLLLSSA